MSETNRSAPFRGLILAGCALALACGGSGEVAVTAYGEPFIEEGVPASGMADGWAVTFDTFEVTLEDIEVGGVSLPDPDPVDLAVASSGAGHPLGTVTVPAGIHSGPSYTVTRMEVVGSATLGEETRTFSWVFDEETRYADCDTETLVQDGTGVFEVTIHADHLFYDSLVSSDPALRFQALADADANGDDEITEAELAAAGIGGYDPGSEAEVTDLWGWLVAQSKTVGHVDGEGHCHTEGSGHAHH